MVMASKQGENMAEKPTQIDRLLRNKGLRFTEALKLRQMQSIPKPFTVWQAQANQFNTRDSDIVADVNKG